MSSIATRHSTRNTKRVSYNENSIWNKSFKESDDESESSESEELNVGSIQPRRSAKKNYKDYSSSELSDGEYYSGEEYQQNEELSDSELEESGNGEEEEEEEDNEFAVQAILGQKDDFKVNTQKNEDEAESEKEEDTEYYVKFQDRAYIHCQWLKRSEIMELENGEQALQKYERKLTKTSLSPSISIDNLLVFEDQEINSVWFEIDRILDERGDEKDDDLEYLVKWKSIDYTDATWEKEKDVKDKSKIAEYKERIQISNPIKIPSRWKRPDPSEYVALTEAPKSKRGDSLRDYQLEGVNWLRNCWYNKRNNILADEMGLGKTAQIVSLLNDLMLNEGIRGPFLVVAPLSTLPHWRNEFENWSGLNTVIYHGNSECRTLIKKLEFTVVNSKGKVMPDRVQFDVVVTNYETILQDFSVFRDIQWRYVVFDEAHKLKNPAGKLYQNVESMYFEHCTMLTGTPIQNKMEELWGLLHLLHPERFNDLDEFSEKYGNMTDSNQVKEIQAIIKPIMLRRKKSDVEKSIAPKEETIVEVELTRVQKKFYRAFLHENAGTLLNQITGGALNSLQNLMMQLRKVCNHPYLIEGGEESILEEKKNDPAYKGLDQNDFELKAMVESSGKLVFVDKLLPKLREGGHKVLIFSQMVRILSIIESFLIARDYKYERIDGSVQENERAAAIDRFNQDPEEFVFLLSTRAGGVGINLTAADTVIIYDSDWNPQNDLQAEARCHRIGQKQKVKVYRLITRDTYEQKMFERASRKLGLDHVVLDGGDMNKEKPMKANEIEEMLRNGVQSLFKDDDSKADEFTSEDIEEILSRRAKVTTTDVFAGGDSIFAKASFNADGDNLDMNSKDFWSQVLPTKHSVSEETLVRRCRKSKIEEEQNQQTTPLFTIMSNITGHGFTNSPGELSVLKQAYAIKKPKTHGDSAALNMILSGNHGEESEIEKLLGENGVKVEPRAEKIIARTAYFFRLRRALYLIQENEIKWPVISPPWEDPVAEYGLMVGVNKYGLHANDLDELPSDKELGLMKTKPLTPAAIEKRVKNLVKAFEDQFSDKLEESFPQDFKPLSPKDWKEKHPSVLARKSLYDNEVLCLFQTMCAIGKPVKGDDVDWERLRDASKLNLVTTSAIQEVAQQMIDLAEREDEKEEEKDEDKEEDNIVDFQDYPKLKPLQGKIMKKDLRKLKQTIKEMSKIYKFVSKLGPKRLEIMKNAPASNGVPEWWTWEHDNSLINNLAQYGLNYCVTWVADKNGPFYAHIPIDLLPQFEEAAKKEMERGKTVKPQDQGEDFLFIFRERSRVARALSVIMYVSKELKKQQKGEESQEAGDEKAKQKKEKAKNDKTNEGIILRVNPSLKIISFGHIMLAKGFFSKSSVYPVGYSCYRRYKVKGTKCPLYWYKCDIEEVNGKPAFKVETVDRPDQKKYESDSPQTVWTMIAEDLAKEINETPKKVVGTWMYGLNSKEVHQELAKLPDADKVPFLNPELEKKPVVQTPVKPVLPIIVSMPDQRNSKQVQTKLNFGPLPTPKVNVKKVASKEDKDK